MAHPGESRADIKRALVELGWEVRTDDEGSGAVMGAHGKYHLMVSFEGEKPTSVLISYVGRGGEILSRKWPGTECLLTPQSVVRAFSREWDVVFFSTPYSRRSGANPPFLSLEMMPPADLITGLL